MTTTDLHAEAETARRQALRAALRDAATGLRLPSGPTGDDTVDAAVAAYRKLAADHRTARSDLAQLEEQRKQAVTADRDAYAAALAAGKDKDPGAPATDKADTAIVAARRKVDALAAAVDNSAAATLDIAYRQASAVRAHAEAEATRALTEAATAIEALTNAIGRHATAAALSRWAADPRVGYREQPTPSPLRRTNGTPYTLTDLTTALRGAFTGSGT